MIHTYKPLPDIVTIKNSDIHGLGIYATKSIDAGCKIGITHYFTKDFGVLRSELGGFINHSSEPNCFILKENDMLHLYAADDIKDREELTVDYLTVPYLLVEDGEEDKVLFI
jgi:SET domain-containing protein